MSEGTHRQGESTQSIKPKPGDTLRCFVIECQVYPVGRRRRLSGNPALARPAKKDHRLRKNSSETGRTNRPASQETGCLTLLQQTAQVDGCSVGAGDIVGEGQRVVGKESEATAVQNYGAEI